MEERGIDRVKREAGQTLVDVRLDNPNAHRHVPPARTEPAPGTKVSQAPTAAALDDFLED